MIFVDTNYFLRYLLSGENKQQQEAKRLIVDGLEGKKKLTTSLIVTFEIYWVLSSFYKKDKKEIAQILSDILSLKFIQLDERNLLFSALEIFKRTNLDLEDAYNVVFAKERKVSEFKTFDIKLQKIFLSLFKEGQRVA